MYFLKCKICGSTLDLEFTDGVTKCATCGNEQTIANIKDEQMSSMFDRVNQLRQRGDYSKALAVLNKIKDMSPDDPEVYFQIALCECEVSFKKDIVSGSFLPIATKKITENDNYKHALELANDAQKSIIQKQGELISSAADGLIEVNLETVDDTVVEKTADVHEFTPEVVVEVKKEIENVDTKVDVEPVDLTTDLPVRDETDKPSVKRKISPVLIAIVAVCIALVAIVSIVIMSLKNASAPTVNDNLKTVQVGETFVFGTYEQDGNASDKEDIEWIVLSKEEGKATLISKYGLECLPYHEDKVPITWENSHIRKWLNETFFKEAFTEEEQSMIPSVEVLNPENPEYGSDPGNDTVDKIYLLNVYEVEEFFPAEEDRVLVPTEHTRSILEKSQYSNNEHVEIISSETGGSSWWLRSPGDYDEFAAAIFNNGRLLYFGYDVNFDYVAVRPVITLTYE